MDSSHATPFPAVGEAVRAHARAAPPLRIGLLTGADDRPYALGLTGGLLARGVGVDFIGSDQVHADELIADPLLRFLNLRGDQSESAGVAAKALRLLRYYARLLGYALTAEPKVFHILWNNKFEWFDRTLLMLIYRVLGRRVVLTAHNVNKAKRDGHDSAFNRATLRMQYRLANHVFVHTEKMRDELLRDFGVAPRRASLVPFGMNEAMPKTGLATAQARERLGIGADDKVLLFFGQIAPYKGLRYLVDALPALLERDPSYRLLIAGKVKQGVDNDWPELDARLAQPGLAARVTRRVQFIPDSDVELYFQAADVLVMPYVDIFQSGVLFLSYDFGLPVVATDVGTLREDIVEGRTGHVCAPRDPAALARAIERHFASVLHQERDASRLAIRAWAHEGHSWAGVAGLSEAVYRDVLVQR
jgi:D-inositol-3-phosphate glycosyltransferase